MPDVRQSETPPESPPDSAPGIASDPTSPPDLPDELRQQTKYKVVRELGRGGMGIVYQAVQTLMDRPVALKVITPAFIAKPRQRARFMAEMKTVAKLDHSNIVRAYDAESFGQLHGLVMEFVEGVSLAEFVKRKGPLPVYLACHLARQAAQGLQHAADKGMVHRDIKPQNLMVTGQGQLKILDFGLALVQMDEPEDSGVRGKSADRGMLGSPLYIAPEQARDAREADVRSDLYSLGCTLFFMLTGRPPFSGSTLSQIVAAHAQQPPPALQSIRTDIPPEMTAIVERLLAKDPADRFQKPADLAQALVPFILEKTGSGRRLGGASAAAAVTAAVSPPLTQPEPVHPASPFHELSGDPDGTDADDTRRRARARRKSKDNPWLIPGIIAAVGAVALLIAGIASMAGSVDKPPVKPAVTPDHPRPEPKDKPREKPRDKRVKKTPAGE